MRAMFKGRSKHLIALIGGRIYFKHKGNIKWKMKQEYI